jgi:antirestriction protein ArdC
MNNAEVYAAITEKIIANLETSGSWQKFWDLPSPVSLNGHFYQGINYLILSNDQFKSRVYGTFGQIRANGGQVRKGEKSTLIVFWKKTEGKNASTGETDSRFILRYYHVFNSEQAHFDEIGKQKIAELDKATIDRKSAQFVPAEQIISGYKDCPEIYYSPVEISPSYSPVADIITMPSENQYATSEDFYRILFHEFGHSVGHPKRLNRFEAFHNKFGDEPYSKEELVAELTSAFLSDKAGLTLRERNSNAYLRSWADSLRDNQKWIIWAASRAEKSAEYILGNAQVILDEDQQQVPELVEQSEPF